MKFNDKGKLQPPTLRCDECDPMPGDCLNCEIQIQGVYKTSWLELRDMLQTLSSQGKVHATVVLQFMDKILERNGGHADGQ